MKPRTLTLLWTERRRSMGVLKRNLWLTGLGAVLAVVALSAVQAGAQPTNVGTLAGTSDDRPGSIVLFPKVIADGTRDTIVLLTNTMNMPASAHCIYLNGAGFCSITRPFRLCTVIPQSTVGGPFLQSDCPDPNDSCVPAWTETNFDVVFTGQQPTMWRVSTGRVLDEFAEANGRCVEYLFGDPPILRQFCPGEFIGGNGVIPPNQPFRGELKCYETGPDDAPFAGNALKGEAIIETLGSPQISKYNSINIEGDFDTGDQILDLNGIEYNTCPQSIEFVHYADIAPSLANNFNPDCNLAGICSGPSPLNGQVCDPTISATCPGGACITCPVRTELTLIPCTQNFEQQAPIPAPVHVDVFDELESPQSAPHVVNCWENALLNNINESTFDFTNRGSQFLKTRIFTSGAGFCWQGVDMLIGAPCDVDDDCGAGGVCGPTPGVIGIMEEFHYTDLSLLPDGEIFPAGTAAFNATMNGLRIGRCRGALGTQCTVGGDECGVDGECLFDRIIVPEVVPATGN